MSVDSARNQFKRTISDPPNGYVTAERAQAAVDIIYEDMLQSDTGIEDLTDIVISDPLSEDQLLAFDGAHWTNVSVIDGGGPF